MLDLSMYDDDILDDLVIDVKLEEGTTVNNAGRDAQLSYLYKAGVTDEEIMDYVAAMVA